MFKALLKDVPFSTPSLVVAILSYKIWWMWKKWSHLSTYWMKYKKPNCEMMDISKTHKILHVLDELDICLDIFIIHYSPQA